MGTVHDPAHLHGRVAHLTSTNVELTSLAPLDPTVTAPLAIGPPPDNPYEWTNNS